MESSELQEIWRRELGLLRPRSFACRVGGSEAVVKRLDLYGKLHGHKGCVNNVHFSPSGDILVSGSDDKDIIFWNWSNKSKILTYCSGHNENVFHAQIMPYTDDRIVVTSAADGQVRFGQVMEDGQVSTRQLGIHRGRVHQLAVEPGSPHIFYSCGEDGLIQQFDLRNETPIKLLTCSSFSENKQSIRLNSITVDPRNPNLFSTGGFDAYARVYDIRNYHWDVSKGLDQPVNNFCPRHLIGSTNVHITGLAYSNKSELLVSYNDELIYMFQKEMGIFTHPKTIQAEALQNLDQPQVYFGHRNSQTVKGVSFFGPCDEYVVSGSDCGHVYIWMKKTGKLLRMMVGDKHIVNSAEPHPFFPFLATSGFDKNIKLWTPMSRRSAPLPKNAKEIMAANKGGREVRARITLSPDVVMHVLTLQRRQALVYREATPTEADSDSDSTPEEGSAADPTECNIS
ncbi:DDB1- and CUL4-associated factor 8 isoform X1 [Dendrobium catenatum]|uniref:DDB1- and CUL4-associated factor 8 isoform X1 n=1 Tax=Dendrobium catenatum TaxID=906689 RepID=UPI00109F31C6|nr:DDB1- and CUL4-associated factor 8 isoform X1 [Dendrobium catenatum]